MGWRAGPSRCSSGPLSVDEPRRLLVQPFEEDLVSAGDGTIRLPQTAHWAVPRLNGLRVWLKPSPEQVLQGGLSLLTQAQKGVPRADLALIENANHTRTWRFPT